MKTFLKNVTNSFSKAEFIINPGLATLLLIGAFFISMIFYVAKTNTTVEVAEVGCTFVSSEFRSNSSAYGDMYFDCGGNRYTLGFHLRDGSGVLVQPMTTNYVCNVTQSRNIVDCKPN
jgi:hypothetical protein